METGSALSRDISYGLESVELEVFLLAQFLAQEELGHVLPLVALQLNHLRESKGYRVKGG